MLRLGYYKDKEGLEVIRLCCSYNGVAVQELFGAVTIGPVIENGFYYDFARKPLQA